MLLKERGEKR